MISTSLKFQFVYLFDLLNSSCFNQAPLCVGGWDEALHEICRLSHETILSPQNATSLLNAVEEMPVLVIAGAEDSHISLKSSQAMASKLVNSVCNPLQFLSSILKIWIFQGWAIFLAYHSFSIPSCSFFKKLKIFHTNSAKLLVGVFTSKHCSCLDRMLPVSGLCYLNVLFTKQLSCVADVAMFVAMQRLVAISGCGHLPHEECPKALLAAISPFISRLLIQTRIAKSQ